MTRKHIPVHIHPSIKHTIYVFLPTGAHVGRWKDQRANRTLPRSDVQRHQSARRILWCPRPQWAGLHNVLFVGDLSCCIMF